MTRYRMIHCLIWNDDKFPFASDDCQLVFFHLMTTPLSTPFGLYKASVEALAAEKRWPLERYRKAFDEILHKGFANFDQNAQVLFLCNFLKYNPPNNPNALKKWGSIFEEIPNCELKTKFYHTLNAWCKEHEAFQEAFGEAFGKGTRKECRIQEQEQEQDNISVQSFEIFWKAYPRKVNKKRSREIWLKLKPDNGLVESILAALERQKRSKQWMKDGGQYIPHPTTWLRGRRWEDEIDEGYDGF